MVPCPLGPVPEPGARSVIRLRAVLYLKSWGANPTIHLKSDPFRVKLVPVLRIASYAMVMEASVHD